MSSPHLNEAKKDSPRNDSVRAPAITLAKGGGAIKGIDEKFAANPVTGTGSLKIPIHTARGRAASSSPQLSLSYDSGAGNGPLGFGWNLAVPAVTRKTDKGLPRYQDDTDTFILADAEDLVPVLQEGNVQRYRPRVETQFSRIERISVDGEPGFFWKITTKENFVTICGRTAAARIADPDDPGRVFKWLPEWSYDDKGNCIEYLYKAEDLDQVPHSLNEKHRVSGLAKFTNRYLKQINYGNKVPYIPDPSQPYLPNPPANQEYFFATVFDFGEHDEAAPSPAELKPWTYRCDSFSDYRAGFEVRTYRLCRRILTFHFFPELSGSNGVEPYLVRSQDLSYRHCKFDGGPFADREADYITSITETGYRKRDDGTYQARSLPSLEFSYHELEWNQDIKTVSSADLVHAPAGIGPNYQWLDLFNEGISGILSEQADGWYYKSNLGGGHFSHANLVAPKPSLQGVANGSLQFQDLDADGTKQLVVNDRGLNGYFELDDDDRWLSFRWFSHLPNVAFNDPNTKFIDLNNDGRAELVISEETAFTWFPSRGRKGFDSPELAPKSMDEEKGPAIVFADATQCIYTADMSGDGLVDIVRIRNGEVCYWPNLGYGKFGAKVSMKNAPHFDHPEQFNPAYLHLADVSGTGATDILYLGKNKFRAWINLSGNAWSEGHEIDPFPTTEQPNQLSVIDLLGNGTACLVWSSSLPRYAPAPLRYIDLMGGKKPYILSGYKNNLGCETRIEYQSSTHYYLLDKHAGRPWVTKLPFPVQCVSKVEVRDRVSDHFFVNEYRYHHGYYDHAEREFRGFGMVEQLDTQTFATFRKSGASNIVGEALHQAPVLTKTWYHTGAFLRQDTILRQFAQEYYSNTAFAEYHLPDAEIVASALSTEELREAHRACKGMVLRQEVYALDGSAEAEHPYSAAEHNYHIRLLQPRGDRSHAVFLVHESEAITYHYERTPTDPRIAHTLNTLLDEYGNVIESASVVYGRQQPDLDQTLEIRMEQARGHITYTQNTFTNDVLLDAAYRLRVLCDMQTFEVTGAQPTDLCFTPAAIREAFLGTTTIAYEAQPTQGALERRLIQHERTLFAADDDVNVPLGFGLLESLGLAYESYKLAFTDTLLIDNYGNRVVEPMLAEGGYIKSDDYKANNRFPASDPDGYWWLPGGVVQYPSNPAAHFYLPDRYVDPFGAQTAVKFYADYHLLLEETEDALGNTTRVQSFDFRVLQPQSIKDANENVSEVSFDVLGLVVGTALKGKGKEADDLASFHPDLTQAEIDAFFADPLAEGANLLQHATSRFVYDLNTAPVCAASIARETHHQQAAAAGQPSRLQFAFEYSGGSGQIVMKKIQAEPGTAKLGQLHLDGSYTVTDVDTTPAARWVGTGRTVLNNKGKAVMQYEPYFSVTHAYESAPELVEIGVTPVMYYDAVGRLIRTEFPDGTLSRVAFNSWLQRTFDRNDTVQASAWYAARVSGGMGQPEQDAAQKAALHHDTPAVAHLDSLGRVFCTVAHNKFHDAATGQLREEFYATRLELDLENNQRRVTDTRGRDILIQQFDMLGAVTHSTSVDAGERWSLQNVAGQPIRSWDSRGQAIRTSYDLLQRPTQLFVQQGNNAEVLAEQTVYGETLTNAVTSNLRGRIYQRYDGAGVLTNELHDFKGNLLRQTRQLAVEYKQQIDWSSPAALLESEIFVTTTEFDALNRPVRLTTPDKSEIAPSYNEANLLERVEARLRGASKPVVFVSGINYDAKGQRTQIDYGNGATTVNDYDEQTFRLARLRTTRAADNVDLQDLTYTYDPQGNVTRIEDGAHDPVYFQNQVVTATAGYTYDALYRLIEASGREHLGQTSGVVNPPVPTTSDDSFRFNLPHPSDGNAMGNYTQRYEYDELGNILKLVHAAMSGSWTRQYGYDPNSNRLLQTGKPSGSVIETYDHDAHGNMIRMPHLKAMQWDFKDQLQAVDLGGGGQAYYAYDSEGQRVRKVWEKQGGLVEERIYLGGHFEIFRRRLNGSLELERETLHVMDDHRRLALVETKTIDNAKPVSAPVSLFRYQFANHLNSSSLELDHDSQIISYEEYYPYGSTSYHAVAAGLDVSPKRYRYTGKEKDEESGFIYYGARYYAAWLCRWTSCDPLIRQNPVNGYQFVANNPLAMIDPDGKCELKIDELKNAKEGDTYTSSNTTFTYSKEFGWTAPEVEVTAERPLSEALVLPADKTAAFTPDLNLNFSRNEFRAGSHGQQQKSSSPDLSGSLDDALNVVGIAADASETGANQLARDFALGSNDMFYIKGPRKGAFHGNQSVDITNKLDEFAAGVGKVGKAVDFLQFAKDAYDLNQAQTPEQARPALGKLVVNLVLARANPVISLTVGAGQLVMSTDEYARTRLKDIKFELSKIEQKWNYQVYFMNLDPRYEELEAERQQLLDRLHPNRRFNVLKIEPPKQFFFNPAP